MPESNKSNQLTETAQGLKDALDAFEQISPNMTQDQNTEKPQVNPTTVAEIKKLITELSK